MKLGPKFKIARRLGAPIFEKTQTAKYAQSLSRKEKSGKIPQRPKSEFGIQLIEKQKTRFTYGISEKQFSKYAKNSLSAKEPAQKLFRRLEMRLDNILYRSGLARTRSAGRQISSHGHALVNGRRVTIPSIELKIGDVVSIREGSKNSELFRDATERMQAISIEWLSNDPEKREVKVASLPNYVPSEHVFDLGAVLEFYSR